MHKHAVTALSTGESYGYDANGNMTSRTEGGLTYTQTFDAENRLISITVSGQTTQFVYDGDGNLIKKIKPDGSKTLYVGGVYEVDKTSGGAVTRTVTYYPVAGAMRIDSTLYYVLKDHLGSASAMTDASGNVVGEQRYYPFGETRLMTGNMQTDKLFTGQREMAGLGIYHFNARFYSPKLGRFLSADTLVPRHANPQAWNRYSYVLNNPIRYTDPTGHKACESDAQSSDGCKYLRLEAASLKADLAQKYKVKLKGKWDDKSIKAVYNAVEIVGTKLATERGTGETASQAFGAVFDGGINFTLGNENASGDCAAPTINSGGCTSSSSQINFWSMAGESSNDMFAMIGNVIHEIGHAYNNQLNKAPETDLGLWPNWTAIVEQRNLILRPNPECDDCWYWQFNRTQSATETFADMFVAWTYNAWNTSTAPENVIAVNNAQAWMNKWLPHNP